MPPNGTGAAAPHLKPTDKSYRTDETYIKVKGEDKYRYRAVDSTGQTIEFLLATKRDAAGAKRFFRRALSAAGNRVPRVINVDKEPCLSGGGGNVESGRGSPSPSSVAPMPVFE